MALADFSANNNSITYIRHAKKASHDIDTPIRQPMNSILLEAPFDCIITSPYLRCRQTAEAINFRGVPIYVDTRVSKYWGKKKGKSTLMHPSSLNFGPIPFINEPPEEYEQRLDEHWQEIIGRNLSILVVTHGMICNRMHQKLFNIKLRNRNKDITCGTGFTVQI